MCSPDWSGEGLEGNENETRDIEMPGLPDLSGKRVVLRYISAPLLEKVQASLVRPETTRRITHLTGDRK